MSLLVAETVVESTTYDALTNAIEAVVKTHTLIESKKVASEIQVVSTSTTTTTTDTKNNVTTEKETLTTNNSEKNNEKKKKQMQKTASIDNNDAPVITIRMLKKVEACMFSRTLRSLYWIASWCLVRTFPKQQQTKVKEQIKTDKRSSINPNLRQMSFF